MEQWSGDAILGTLRFILFVYPQIWVFLISSKILLTSSDIIQQNGLYTRLILFNYLNCCSRKNIDYLSGILKNLFLPEYYFT